MADENINTGSTESTEPTGPTEPTSQEATDAQAPETQQYDPQQIEEWRKAYENREAWQRANTQRAQEIAQWQEFVRLMDRYPDLAHEFAQKLAERLGVEVRTGVEVVRFETDEQGRTTVIARPWPRQEGAPELRFPAETVVIAMGLRPDRSLVEALADRPNVYAIGDCVEPREAVDAIREGFQVGLEI